MNWVSAYSLALENKIPNLNKKVLMKYWTRVAKIPHDKLFHYYVWQEKTLCGISLEDKQLIKSNFDNHNPVCPECANKSRPRFLSELHRAITSKNAPAYLGILKLLFDMIDEKDQGILGLVEMMEFDDAKLFKYLDTDDHRLPTSKQQEANNGDDHLNIRSLNHSFPIPRIELFRNLLIEVLDDNWKYRLN